MGTESVRDIKYDFLAAKQGGAEKTHEFFATKLAEKLRKIEGSLPPTTETDACPWLVGSRFSYADLCYFGFLTDARALWNTFLSLPTRMQLPRRSRKAARG